MYHLITFLINLFFFLEIFWYIWKVPKTIWQWVSSLLMIPVPSHLLSNVFAYLETFGYIYIKKGEDIRSSSFFRKIWIPRESTTKFVSFFTSDTFCVILSLSSYICFFFFFWKYYNIWIHLDGIKNYASSFTSNASYAILSFF